VMPILRRRGLLAGGDAGVPALVPERGVPAYLSPSAAR
jgi:hypothetical protein